MFSEVPEWHAHPYFAHGCRGGHSREEAIVIALISSAKLCKGGYSHINVFHDMTNAFLCTPHRTLDINARMCCDSAQDAKLLIERHHQACIKIDAPDGEVVLNLGVGGMVGDHGGPVEFMNAFHPVISKWNESVQTCNEHILLSTNPVDGSNVDLGLTSYVDDIHAKHLFNERDRLTSEPIARIEAANEKLDHLRGRLCTERKKARERPDFHWKTCQAKLSVFCQHVLCPWPGGLPTACQVFRLKICSASRSSIRD